MGRKAGTGQDSATQGDHEALVEQAVNEVHLVGRVAATPSSRILPSGDTVTSLRLVVPRPSGSRRSARGPTLDTLDCAIWTSRIRQRAETLAPGTLVEIDGALRRRFWRSAAGPASRYEVEVLALRRVAKSRAAAG
jgi:single-strand DNA-binding protein